MQEIVVFKFKVFDDSIKQKAMNVLWAFPGVTSVKLEEECQLKVTGEFDKYQMAKELKKIDESVDILEDGVAAKAEVDYNPFKDATGSSNWTTLQPYELWEQAKVIGAGAAEKAKVIGAGGAEKAKVIGAGAARLIPSNKKEKVTKQKHFDEDQFYNPNEGEGILAGVAR